MIYDNNATHTPKELFQELQALAVEAKTMMSDSITENSAEAMKNLRIRFDSAHARFNEIYDDTKKHVVAGAKYTDTSIRENPYQSVAIALGVGVVLGLLVGRKK